MNRWMGRVALVTGASSGIGFAITKDLVQQGMKVVGVARNISKIQDLSKELAQSKGSLVAMKCDLSKDQDVYDVFNKIKETLGGVDVCINNAGFSCNSSLLDGTPEEWRSQTDVNVIALCLCTKLAVASMRDRGVDDGHIINISSMSGHRVPLSTSGTGHFYSGTKFAVRAITEGLRQELRAAKSHIRATVISPGLVETGFALRKTNNEQKSRDTYSGLEVLQAEDVSASVLHALTAPAHVEINDIMMRPTEQSV